MKTSYKMGCKEDLLLQKSLSGQEYLSVVMLRALAQANTGRAQITIEQNGFDLSIRLGNGINFDASVTNYYENLGFLRGRRERKEISVSIPPGGEDVEFEDARGNNIHIIRVGREDTWGLLVNNLKKLNVMPKMGARTGSLELRH